MSWSLRCLPESELGRLMDLVRVCYGSDAEPPDWWRWRYFDPEAPRSLVVIAEEAGAMIGVQCLSFGLFEIDDKDVVVGELTGGMVSPQHRGRGVFSSLVDCVERMAWGEGARILFTMPNGRSVRAFRRKSWRNVGERTLMIRPSILASHSEVPGATGRVQEELFDQFGNRFPALFDGAIKRRRTARWLRWRFGGNPLNQYGFGVIYENGAPVAYAATTTIKKRGQGVGVIVEAMATSDEVTAVVVRKAVLALRRKGVRLIATVPPSSQSRLPFLKNGFVPTPRLIAPKRFYTMARIKPGENGLSQKLRNPRSWGLTLGDWDAL